MWKTLLLLAVALSIARAYGAYSNGLGVSSWDQMLADIVQGQNAQTGSCGDMCYVNVDGDNHLMERGESFHSPTDPCLKYTCQSSGVKQEKIQCPPAEVNCNNGAPVRYPGMCCRQCEGRSGEPPLEFEDWSVWTECSRTCGGGKRARMRTCKIIDGADFAECTGPLREVKDCNANPCPEHCQWKWGPFEQCSRTCGGGIKRRFPIITQRSQHGGQDCPPNVLNEEPDTLVCNTDDCPVDCVWGPWRSWSQCSALCGGGTRTSSRGKSEARNGGKPCVGSATHTEECNAQPCPVDCKFSEWSGWGQCSKTCEGGLRRRTRGKEEAMYGGRPCVGELEEFIGCNVGVKCSPPCPDGHNRCNGICIPDMDKDCVNDGKDNCKETYNPQQKDEDNDGVGDACDNCKYGPNPKQENNDGDDTGDICDTDDDNDGVVDGQDNCPLVYNPNQSSKDPFRYGSKCTTPSSSSAMRMDTSPIGSDKKGLAAEMEKLLEMYYSN